MHVNGVAEKCVCCLGGWGEGLHRLASHLITHTHTLTHTHIQSTLTAKTVHSLTHTWAVLWSESEEGSWRIADSGVCADSSKGK